MSESEKKKDWISSTASPYRIIGASNHSDTEREAEDYYATDPAAVEQLCVLVPLACDIWEPACGEGHISKTLEGRGHRVLSTDLVDRGYGRGGIDFLSPLFRESACPGGTWRGDIVTNPPYRYAEEFVETALSVVEAGAKVCFLLKLTFLEGVARRQLFWAHPPRYVYVATHRLRCPKNGDFSGGQPSAMCFAWFVWEKGFRGDPAVRWFN